MHEEHKGKLRYVHANRGRHFSHWKITRSGNIRKQSTYLLTPWNRVLLEKL